MHWQLNPDVTVRQKGIMEKCTFCVQRIKEAENRAALEQRASVGEDGVRIDGLRPDEFTTACAQACPSRAIVFGDAADDQWSVAQWVKDRRAYHVVEELNTYTAVVDLQKVNHPAPTASATAAISFTNVSLVARNELAAYLDSSADSGSVRTTGDASRWCR